MRYELGRIDKRRGPDGKVVQWIVHIHDAIHQEGAGTRTGKTKAIAVARAKVRISELEAGAGSGVKTVQDALQHFWDTKAETWKPATVLGNEAARRAITPLLGTVRIHDLTSTIVRESKLSRAQVVLLRSTMNQCVRDRYLSSNPLAGVQLPASGKVRGTQDRRPYSVNEMTSLLDHLEAEAARGDQEQVQDRLRFSLALTTGMRQSEVLGLRWTDVDVEAGVINLEHQLWTSGPGSIPKDAQIRYTIAPERAYLIDPKTDDSRRSIPIPKFLLPALTPPEGVESTEMIFKSRRSQWCASRTDLDRWKKVVTGANLPYRQPHALRNSTISLLGPELGVQQRVIMDIVGHSDSKSAMTIQYQSSTPQQRQAAMDALTKLLNR